MFHIKNSKSLHPNIANHFTDANIKSEVPWRFSNKTSDFAFTIAKEIREKYLVESGGKYLVESGGKC